jgi:hypothetical protein
MTQEDGEQEEIVWSGRINRIKRHVKENKKVYFASAGTGACCLAVGLYFRRPIVIDFKPVIEITNSPTFNNHIENNLGPMSKIVRDVMTNEEWQKIKYLAEKIAKDQGISYDSARVMLGKHFRGELDDVFGRVYEIAGLRASA